VERFGKLGPELGRLRQANCEFEARLGYIVRSWFKQTNKRDFAGMLSAEIPGGAKLDTPKKAFVSDSP
jgi:hypothetical protein